MFQPLVANLLLTQTKLKVIASVTGRTQAQQDRIGIVKIMVAVGGMKVHRVFHSGTLGCAFPAVPDMAMEAPPACLLLTCCG